LAPRFLIEDLAAQMLGKRREDLVFAAPGRGVLRIATFRARVFNAAVGKLLGLDENGEPTTDWPRPTLHDLRHTAASVAISAGANVKAVQTMLGHKSAALTLKPTQTCSPMIWRRSRMLWDAAVRTLRGSAADALRTQAESAGGQTTSRPLFLLVGALL
jgi:integrase